MKLLLASIVLLFSLASHANRYNFYNDRIPKDLDMSNLFVSMNYIKAYESINEKTKDKLKVTSNDKRKSLIKIEHIRSVLLTENTLTVFESERRARVNQKNTKNKKDRLKLTKILNSLEEVVNNPNIDKEKLKEIYKLIDKTYLAIDSYAKAFNFYMSERRPLDIHKNQIDTDEYHSFDSPLELLAKIAYSYIPMFVNTVITAPGIAFTQGTNESKRGEVENLLNSIEPVIENTKTSLNK